MSGLYVNLLFELIFDDLAAGLFGLDELTAPHELLPHELDSAFQHDAFGAALALKTRYQDTQTVKAVADGLSSLLLYRAWLA